MNLIGQVVPMFLDNRQIQCLSVHYLKTSEPLNGLHSLVDQFVPYNHGKVCRYQVFNIFTQYV